MAVCPGVYLSLPSNIRFLSHSGPVLREKGHGIFLPLAIWNKERDKNIYNARKSLKPTERVQKRRTSEAWLSFFSDERSVMGLFVVMVVWMKTEKKTATLIFI